MKINPDPWHKQEKAPHVRFDGGAIGGGAFSGLKIARILSSPQWRRGYPGAGPWGIQDSPGSPGAEHHSQEPLIWVTWSPLCGGTLSTDVNACGGDAPIAVVRPGDVNPGANRDGARGDGLTGPCVLGGR